MDTGFRRCDGLAFVIGAMETQLQRRIYPALSVIPVKTGIQAGMGSGA